MTLQSCTLGGGCFWCIEAVFQNIKGVTKVVSGYAGGHVVNPTYEQICEKNTGHAEVIQIEFNDSLISFSTVLDVFFEIHDPTTPNRQGNDEGPQYRSVIFYHDAEQKNLALAHIKALSESKKWTDPIVTEVAELIRFYPAEEHHQNYFSNNPVQGYCLFVVAPKVMHFREMFSHLLKS